MGSGHFFDESRDQSIVKAEIVAKYFWAWANVIDRYSKTFAYIDLFAGPGRYKDGSASTPLLVLERAIHDPKMHPKLVTVFNDLDLNNSRTLERQINALEGIEVLHHRPRVYNEEVGIRIVEEFERAKLVPSLTFVDPWGYKGLSLRLVQAVLKDWGCDCIFFFNYNRINMGLTNPFVVDHMNALFGDERADDLRQRLKYVTPEQRELAIVNELGLALKQMGGEFVLPFTFKNDSGQRTSHHLTFVSKNKRGYGIMKEIMASYSSSTQQGVASFEYSPVDNRQLRLLFDYARPLDDLADLLLTAFKGRTMSMEQLFEAHNVGLPYIAKNYKDVLAQLEREGRITATPPATQRRTKKDGSVTFGNSVMVTFP